VGKNIVCMSPDECMQIFAHLPDPCLRSHTPLSDNSAAAADVKEFSTRSHTQNIIMCSEGIYYMAHER